MKTIRTATLFFAFILASCETKQDDVQTVFCERYKSRLPVKEWDDVRLKIHKLAIENDAGKFEDDSFYIEGTPSNRLSVKFKTGKSTVSLA